MEYITYYNSPVGKITIAGEDESITGLWIEGQKYYASTSVSYTHLDVYKRQADAQVQAVQYDSRKVGKGDLFVCITGFQSDGHNYARSAAEKGASVIVAEHEVDVPDGVTVVIAENTRLALAQISAAYYDFPSEKINVIGVTGTNGKTTTTYLIKTILDNIDVYKRQLIVPAKFREGLGEHFIVTKGIDRCLYIYPRTEWEAFEAKLRELPLANADARRFTRSFLSGAVECDVDNQGRIIIPQSLRNYAGLVKEVVSAGVGLSLIHILYGMMC